MSFLPGVNAAGSRTEKTSRPTRRTFAYTWQIDGDTQFSDRAVHGVGTPPEVGQARLFTRKSEAEVRKAGGLRDQLIPAQDVEGWHAVHKGYGHMWQHLAAVADANADGRISRSTRWRLSGTWCPTRRRTSSPSSG